MAFKLRSTDTVRIAFDDGSVVEAEWDDVWEELRFHNEIRHDPCHGEILVGTSADDAQ